MDALEQTGRVSTHDLAPILSGLISKYVTFPQTLRPHAFHRPRRPLLSFQQLNLHDLPRHLQLPIQVVRQRRLPPVFHHILQ